MHYFWKEDLLGVAANDDDEEKLQQNENQAIIDCTLREKERRSKKHKETEGERELERDKIRNKYAISKTQHSGLFGSFKMNQLEVESLGQKSNESAKQQKALTSDTLKEFTNKEKIEAEKKKICPQCHLS